jgi:long-chain acyl-CoA synthetase
MLEIMLLLFYNIIYKHLFLEDDMPSKEKHDPLKFLEDFRGKDFNEKWPTLVEMFEITVKRYGNNACFKQFVPEELALNYTQAREKIIGAANYILTFANPKDKIALCGKNSVEWAISYLAIVYAGCIVVPLDANLKDHEIDKLIKFAEVKALYADSGKLESLAKDKEIILEKKISLEKNGSDNYLLDNLIEGELNKKAYKATSQDLAAILFTSGTTGTPKGVMLTHENLVSDCYLAQCNMSIYSTDVFYAILPIHHAYTMLAVFIEGISVGAEIIFGKRLIISQVLKELKVGKVTMFLGVPMLFNKLLAGLLNGVKKKSIILYGFIRFLMSISGLIKKITKKNVGHKMFKFLLKQISLDTNRICICGGGPLPSSTFKMFNELGIDFVQGYGLTETSPITHLNPTEAYIESSVGKIIPTLEQKIVDPDSEGNGVLYIKGSVVMKGYYNNEEATKEILNSDGWLNTGDMGHIDNNGYLYLTGRAKNIIVTEGGKNVFPEEIEDHFQLYNEIDQICVVPFIKNEATKSEGIKALIYPNQDWIKEVSEKQVEKRINEIIAEVNKDSIQYKRIEKVFITKEPLPTTSTKKIKRFEVAKLYK